MEYSTRIFSIFKYKVHGNTTEKLFPPAASVPISAIGQIHCSSDGIMHNVSWREFEDLPLVSSCPQRVPRQSVELQPIDIDSTRNWIPFLSFCIAQDGPRPIVTIMFSRPVPRAPCRGQAAGVPEGSHLSIVAAISDLE